MCRRTKTSVCTAMLGACRSQCWCDMGNVKTIAGSGSGLVATDGNAPVRALQFLELVQFITAHSSQVRCTAWVLVASIS